MNGRQKSEPGYTWIITGSNCQLKAKQKEHQKLVDFLSSLPVSKIFFI